VKLLSVAIIAIGGLASPRTALADDPVCFAGGPGSTQCSVGTVCSVTCSKGYACCHATDGCRCIGGDEE
jgi:hypothetical protein